MKPHGIIVDNFAGGGGASTGIEAALGRAVDIAINHDEEAIRMHEVNHPGTVHIRNNIWQVDPRDVVQGRRVALAWFSPDCKHFSKAKGGKPREKSIRDLAWVVVLWAEKVKPDLILLENVEEFRTWGPLCPDGFPIKERAGETFDKWCKALRKAGYKLQFKELRACDYGAPTIRKRFFMVARRDGLPIVWPAPTHGKPDSADVLSGKLKPWRTAAEIIDWSIPCPSIFERKKPLAEKTLRRIAHGIMKFVVNNPKPFIVGAARFETDPTSGGSRLWEPSDLNSDNSSSSNALTKKAKSSRAPNMPPPSPHTISGTARPTGGRSNAGGVNPPSAATPDVTPFIAPLTHQGSDARSYGLDSPLHTVTGANRGEMAIIAPHVTKFRNGAIGHGVDEPMHTVTANSFVKRPGGAAPLGLVEAALSPVIVGCGGRRGQSAPVGPEQPYPTTTAKADACVVAAFLERQFGKSEGAAVDGPLPTTTAGGGGKSAVVIAHIEQANGGPNNDNLAGRPADAPLSTVATTGSQQRLVTSNLMKLRGGDESHLESSSVDVKEPLHTICASGTHMAEVRAFLIKYYGNEQDGHGITNPLGTVTMQDRFGLVTVTIDGDEYVIVDIGMRMLTPRELFNAQGFPPDYIIDRDAHGKPMTKTAQVAKCGNSVCPPLSEALVRANMADAIDERQAA